jgi:hypothetical protein
MLCFSPPLSIRRRAAGLTASGALFLGDACEVARRWHGSGSIDACPGPARATAPKPATDIACRLAGPADWCRFVDGPRQDLRGGPRSSDPPMFAQDGRAATGRSTVLRRADRRRVEASSESTNAVT